MADRMLPDDESVAIWDVLMDATPQLVIYLRADNTIRQVSRAARQYFDLGEVADCQGRGLLEVIGNPVLALLARRWLAELDAGRAVDEEFPLDRQKNDQYEWFRVRASVAESEGRVVGKVFFINDVTALYSQKKIVNTLIDSVPGRIVVFDRNLTILLASESVARENGFGSWEDLVGLSLHDLSTLDVTFVEGLIERLILGEETIQEIRRIGDKLGAPRWDYIDVRTVKSSAGTFGYIMTVLDMTGEIKPKAVLDSLLEASSDQIAILDPSGVVEYASRSIVQSLGFKSWKELVGAPWQVLFKYHGQELANDPRIADASLERSVRGTVPLKTPAGERWFNFKIDPLLYHGEPIGFLAVATDTTELVEARDKAESAARAKAAFLANMSHELRTPMNAVIGMNELLARTPLNPLQKNYVSHVRTSATMLLSIINDILDFSRIEAQRMTLNEAPYRFESLLHDVINLVSVKVAEKELSFSADVDPDVPAVLVGDEIRVKQVLINLLNNAVKFTDSGEVSLSVSARFERGGFRSAASRKPVELTVRVRDTGVGIPKEKQDELFGRFSRIESERSASVEGTGLGLSICKGLVVLMGGDLAVESDEGAGSVFTARITQGLADDISPIARYPDPAGIRLLLFSEDRPTLASIEGMARRARVPFESCWVAEEFRARLEAENPAPTHVVFDFRSGREAAGPFLGALPGVRWLALLSFSDFIGSGRDQGTDFVFKPLVTPTFARFLSGERVDFSSSLPLVTSLGLDAQYFRATGTRVLVVDDNAVNRKVAEGFLRTFDVQVDEAGSGEEALRLAAGVKYDLVLMDHLMPGMDGIETAKRMREIPGYAEGVPIVAMTANVGETYVRQYRDAGMNDFLFKPIEFSAFAAALRRWLPGGDAPPNGARQSPGESPNQGAAATPPAEGDWIPGLDRAAAIGYTGSEQALRAILAVFARTGPKMLSELETASRSGNVSAYRGAAHSLISSMANIGATSLSAHARELEQAIIAGNEEGADNLYPIVHQELESALSSVVDFLAKDGGKK